MLESPDLYRSFCKKNGDILPLCFEPWWLDMAVGAHQWRGYVIQNSAAQIVGVWPVCTRRKWGIPYHTLPFFTLYNGPWFLPGYTPEADFLKNALRKMPPALYQIVHGFYAPLPEEVWQSCGFSTNYYHTYRLPAGVSVGQLFKQFKNTTRSRILKAQQRLQVDTATHFEVFSPLYEAFLKEKGLFFSEANGILEQIVRESRTRQQGQLLCARDADNRLIAGIVLVWDACTTYCIVTASDSNFRHLNAVRLLLWQAIQDAVARGHVFDFEGGDVPSIGDFFASFGAEKTPYIRAVQYPNALVSTAVRGLKWMRGGDPLFR